MNRTKIVATIGPSTFSSQSIAKLLDEGVDVIRLNMSHLRNPSETKDVVGRIKEISNKKSKFIPILFDLSGPKIRVKHTFLNFKITKGKSYTLGSSKAADIPINYKLKIKSIASNAQVKIEDGKIVFKVIEKKDHCLVVKALKSGTVKPSKGVNLPGVALTLPSITKKDRKDLKLGLDLGVDWIALSFVRKASDIRNIKKTIRSLNAKALVMAKIEKPEAVENLDSIISESDGILVARGDLGVEVDYEKVPVLQRKIIQKCRIASKPVVVATQMLESMIKKSSPTRAEVNDVASAVYDNVDAVMLSAETSIGKFPFESVRVMRTIANKLELEEVNNFYHKQKLENRLDTIQSAISHAVFRLTLDLDINAVVVMTESGSTSRFVSSYRPKAPIFALSPYESICRQMNIIWGVVPLKVDSLIDTDKMIGVAEKILKSKKMIQKNQLFVITAGVPVGEVGTTNMLKVHKIT